MKFSILFTSLLSALSVQFSLSQTTMWINEFHYDDTDGSTGNTKSFMEFAYTGGPLDGFKVFFYNGFNGRSYSNYEFGDGFDYTPPSVNFVALAFTIQKGGTYSVPEADGFAVVHPNGTVLEFISYEGSFTATNGPATGKTSVNIGVKEKGSTTVGYSLQKCPNLPNLWYGPTTATKGQANGACTTNSPVISPSRAPSSNPTEKPSRTPSRFPTEKPSVNPTEMPTEKPSTNPTEKPSKTPSRFPTEKPSTNPTEKPSKVPSKAPSASPTISRFPTAEPSSNPTEKPSRSPSESPTRDCDITWNLYDSSTNSFVTELTNGKVITNPPPCGRNNIEAVIPCSGNRVIFELWRGSRLFRRRRDYFSRYFLYGNLGQAIFGGRIPAGSYGIRVIVDDTVSRFTNFTMGGSCWW